MNTRFRTVAAALGFTTICLPQLLEPLVRPDHNVVYHWSGRAAALFFPVAATTVVVWAALIALLFSAERPGRWRSMVWFGLLVLLPWIVDHDLDLWPGVLPHWATMPPIWVAPLLWLVVVLLWRSRSQARYEAVIDVASTVLVFVALSGAFFLSEFTWFWWQARALNAPRSLHQGQVVAAVNRPRIIWIVLDELSYQQVYGHRYPGLQLPAFDALAKQATVFTRVTPASNRTEKAVPSLFTGDAVDAVRSSPDGLLSVHLEKAETWGRFNEHDTVFQDALNAGYSTAVAGWFNPYCRILPTVLDQCYWTDHYSEKDGAVWKGSFRSTLAGLAGYGSLHEVICRLLRIPVRGAQRRKTHIEDYGDLSAAADKVLLDSDARFAFLHLPIPHPDGIYNRRTKELTTGYSTYIDNLALADRYLAHVRIELERSGQWDSSTIIVMGDHGWRTTLLWEDRPGWTAEEERASLGGKYDKRPAYIVKLAGQTTGARIDAPFDAVRTRALMDGLMTGQIRTADDLKTWVESGAPVKAEYTAALR